MYIDINTEDFSLVRNMEPHKCLGWFMLSVEELRANSDKLFYPLRDFFNKFPNIKIASDLRKMIKRFGIKAEL